ncbi:conserved hypothetical protein [Candidatus Sulfopaludibacter sp. SbA4]|nr:conserved hypothetical protein [Candidatus Sulfopaludibacter sp. SbA4]
MVAASDTSAVSNLALIGRLHLLQSQFQIVWIPDAVRAELEEIPSPAAKALVGHAYQVGWLKRRVVANPAMAAALANDLDKGEGRSDRLGDRDSTGRPADR